MTVVNRAELLERLKRQGGGFTGGKTTPQANMAGRTVAGVTYQSDIGKGTNPFTGGTWAGHGATNFSTGDTTLKKFLGKDRAAATVGMSPEEQGTIDQSYNPATGQVEWTSGGVVRGAQKAAPAAAPQAQAGSQKASKSAAPGGGDPRLNDGIRGNARGASGGGAGALQGLAGAMGGGGGAISGGAAGDTGGAASSGVSGAFGLAEGVPAGAGQAPFTPPMAPGYRYGLGMRAYPMDNPMLAGLRQIY